MNTLNTFIITAFKQYSVSNTNQCSLSFRYFVHLNNTLFQTLFEVASTPDRILTTEVVRRIGLDPKSDLSFLHDLTELYGINVHIPVPTCCPFYEPQYQ